MIVVSVGTNEARFDRLLTWVAGLRSEEPLVVQHGPSSVRPPGASCVEFLPFEELVALVRRSRAFVTHAGVGSIMMSLAAGRRPIVVPRLKRFGEAVDDHQVPLATRLGAEGMLTVVQTPEELERALSGLEHAVATGSGATALAGDLRSYLLGLCRPGA
jgi:UDP-N-acetylglucosamine transferase subunit ALG13